MTLKPFRGRAGFDAANNRGINLDSPIDDGDFANKIFVEERVAAGARIRGSYYPDSDGRESAGPLLRAYTPGVGVNRALNADYWIVAADGRSDDDVFRWRYLGSGDRVIAKEVPANGGAVQGALDVTAIQNLRPSWRSYVEANSPNGGRGLGLDMNADAFGDGNFTIANRGEGYTAGEQFDVVIPNDYNGVIVSLVNYVPAAFTLSPNTTYYNVEITGGTGAGVYVNARTDATGTSISELFLIDGGAGYTTGDTLTIVIEGQTIGTYDVSAAFTGVDQTFTLRILSIHSTDELTFELVRGGGLTRQQADRDYLRLDAANYPTRDISWNGQRLTNLGNPVDPQDAVNLQTLNTNSLRLYLVVSLIGHGFVTGDAVAWNALTGTWQYAQADSYNTLASGLIEVIDADSFYVITQGLINWPAHGYPLGELLYLDPEVLNRLIIQRPTHGYIQAVARVRTADNISMLEQAVVYTGF